MRFINVGALDRPIQSMSMTHGPSSVTTTQRERPEPSANDASHRGTGRSWFAGKSIYFLGIGGCGVSGLARLLREFGATCQGADSTPSEVTEALARDGFAVSHDESTPLPESCGLMITSAAIQSDHPQLLAANARGIAVLTYAEALGRVQGECTGVSIAGTHGKSTTTAMLCHALIQCGLDPSFILGAQCPQIGGGRRVGGAGVPADPALPGPAGQPRVFVAEACEFNRSFHCPQPRIALITNIEEDHLDVYGTLDKVVLAFAEFAQRLPAREHGGRLLIAHTGAHRRAVTAGLACDVATFGFSPVADYQVTLDETTQRVGVARDGHVLAQWTNRMPGEHNALNAAAAAILANWLGGAWPMIGAALDIFHGLERRMQRLGTRIVNGGQVIVYDDYGHHPTEIEKTLTALRRAEQPKRLICVFQPHQHSRTRFLLEEFAQSFQQADHVIVPHIYFVRDSENEKQRISARDLVDRLSEQGV